MTLAYSAKINKGVEMKKKRFRLRFVFWLDMLKTQEQDIAERIEVLKDERLFSKAIRIGILIFDDLRQGNIDQLVQYFPWVKDKIIAQYSSETNIEAQMSRLEELIQQQNTFAQTQSPSSNYIGSFGYPDNDIALEEKEEEVDSATITKNLNQSLLSMFS